MFWDWHAIARDASGTQSAAASSPAAGGPGVKIFPGSAASHPGTGASRPDSFPRFCRLSFRYSRAPLPSQEHPSDPGQISRRFCRPLRPAPFLPAQAGTPATPERLSDSGLPRCRRRPLSSFFRHSCGPGNLPRLRLSPQTVPSRSARLSLCRSGRKWTDLPLADKKQGKLQACPARLRAGLPASEKA